MKTKVIKIGKFITQGLVTNRNPRNNPQLIESLGAHPYEGVLQAEEQLTLIDTSSLGVLTFPYPQLFVFDDVFVVCTSTAIYEFTPPTTFSQKLSGLTLGTTWEGIESKGFIWLTNGQVSVKKDPVTHSWSTDSTLPYGTGLCNIDGQVFVGSPTTPASGAI